MAAPKPCTACGVLVRDGTARCDAHKRKDSNFTRRLTRHQRGYGAEWDRIRQTVLKRDNGLCVPCQKAGRITLGNIVDHITPKAEGGTDDDGNLQTICKRCHDLKTAQESARGGAAVQGKPEWLPAARVPVVIVCGPPGSGKRMHVAQLAGPDDLVIDLDVLAAELSGRPLHQATREERMAAVRLRNRLLADLASPGCTFERAWFIVTAGTPADRAWWLQKLGPLARLEVMTTPKPACVARVMADTRRPPVARQEACAAILRWC